jgi:hypothetical protein
VAEIHAGRFGWSWVKDLAPVESDQGLKQNRF